MSETLKGILASKLLEQRTRLGWSQKQIAGYLQVEPPTVSRWESKTSWPDSGVVEKLATLYGVPPSYFYMAEKIEPPKPTAVEALEVLCAAAGIQITGKLQQGVPAALSDRDRRILEVFRGLNDDDLNFILEDVVPDVKAGLDRRPADTGESTRITRKPQKG